MEDPTVQREYVLEVVGGVNIQEFACAKKEDAQIKKARKLARANGRAAVLSGEVQYFWAEVLSNGKLVVGAFDEDLFEEN